jgi:transglutaminase-like putative cysteine protease
MKRWGLGGLLALVWATSALAQPAPIRWGEVPPDHLAMTEFPGDPDAQAVILADYGKVEVTTDADVSFERHRRIKLLSPGGYSLATVSLVYDPRNRVQAVAEIRGQTHIRQPDGSVRRVALERNSIFTENLQDGRRRVTFTLPALEPGAVFEYSYRFSSTDPIFLPDWYFQDSEPVLWSEFRVEHPGTIGYAFVTRSTRPFALRTDETARRPGLELRLRRWVAENVPALREEPFMTTSEDYLQMVKGQLVEFATPGRVVRVLKTWEELASVLAEHASFGRLLNAPRAVRRQAEEVAGQLTEPEEKARAVYDYVRTRVVWDGRLEILADNTPARVLEVRRGNAAEINLLLVAMLRQVGLDAEGALVSTRDHGSVIEQFPIITQFNLAVAAVRLGDSWVLLDATDPNRPFGLLPSAALNGRAWVAARRPQWVNITPAMSTHNLHLDGEVTADGALVGTLRSERAGYSGVDARYELVEYGVEGYVGLHLLGGAAGLDVSDVAIEHADYPSQPLVTTANVRLDGYLQSIGDLEMIHVKPLMREGESPFTRTTRTFPVDFAYPRVEEFSAEIRLPAGAVVAELPPYAFFVVPNRGGVYERKLEVRDGVMYVTVKRAVLRARFEPTEYGAVRDFFDRVAAAERDVIVLRTAPPAITTDP